MAAALLLISHGSRSAQSRREVADLAQVLGKKSGCAIVEFAFLEVDKPAIPEGVEACIRRGARHIIVLPHFLTSGNHVLNDIPRILSEAAHKHPDVTIEVAPFVGSHERVPELMLELSRQARPVA